MSLRARLRLLAWGSLLTILLAVFLWWRGHQLTHVQRDKARYIGQLRGAVLNLNVLTLELLHDNAGRLATSQWRAIHRRIGERLRDPRLAELPNQTLLRNAHARLAQRLDLFQQARARCRADHRRSDSRSCKTLLRRLGTQLRLVLQELFVEIDHADEWTTRQLDRLSETAAGLMLSLLALLTLSTAIILWPVTRRINRGLSRLLAASERFGAGDPEPPLPLDGNDEITRLGAAFQQMAEQRKAVEERLRHNRAWLEKLLDTLPHGVQENDRNGVITYANLALHRMLEAPPGSLVGRAIEDVLSEPGQRRCARRWLRRIVSRLPEPRPFVIHYQTLSGRPLIVEISWSYQRDDHGEVRGFLSVVSDVSARVRAEKARAASEANLSEAQHIARIGSWELHLPDRALHCSEELLRILEWPPDRGIRARDFIERVHPEDRKQLTAAYSQAVRRRRSHDFVHRLLIDGRVKYVRERGRTEYAANGRPLRSIGTTQDISEQIRTERQLQYRLRIEAALAEVSTRLARTLDIDDERLLDEALRIIGRGVGADRAYLFQLDTDARCLDNTHEWRAPGVTSQKAELQRVPIADYAAVFRRFQRGETLRLSVTGKADSELQPLLGFMRASGIRSLINVPVIDAGRLLGVVGFDAVREEREWPAEDARLLRTLAESLGGVLTRREAKRRLADHTWYLESLDRVSRLIAGRWPSQNLLNELTGLLLELFDTTRAWLLCANDDAPGYHIIAEATRPGARRAMESGLTISEDDCAREPGPRIFASGEPQVVQSDELTDPPDYLADYQIGSQLIVAIPSYGEQRCVLGLHHCAGRRAWSPVEKQLFKAIAERVALTRAGGELLERLQESQRRLLEAERIANIGSWELRLDDQEMHWSAQQYRLLGLRDDTRPRLFAMLDLVHPDDHSRVKRAFQALIGGRRSSLDIEHRLLRGTGGECVVHQLAIAEQDDRGNALRLIGTTQDVTERVRLERELTVHRRHLEELVEERTATIQRQAQIIEQIHGAMLTTDLDGRITSWNSGAEHLFGYSASDAIGRDISLLHRPEERARLRSDIINPLLAEGRLETDAERQRADGRLVPVHLSLSLLRDEAGQPIGIIGYAIDISERKRQERELQALTERLEASNKELESFSYSVSHDLRAPLRAIDGFSLALIEDYGDQLDAPALDYLQRLRAGAQRMGRLIDDLLQLSRLNRADLRREPLDLARIADGIVAELRAGSPEREVDVEIDHPMPALGDARLLHVMLSNLLGNAWKFTVRTNEARIRFGRDARRPGVFYIQDNGAGFDMRHADKLFGAFQRLHRVSEFPGSGIGLATVQRILHRHGGWIRARGAPHQGAVFSFSLQADTPPDETKFEGERSEKQDTAAGGRQSG